MTSLLLFITCGLIIASFLVSMQDTVIPLSWSQKHLRHQSATRLILCTLALLIFEGSQSSSLMPTASKFFVICATFVHLNALQNSASAWAHRRIFPFVASIFIVMTLVLTMGPVGGREVLIVVTMLSALGHIRHINKETRELSDNYRDLTQRLVTLEALQRSISSLVLNAPSDIQSHSLSVARDKSKEAS